MSRFAEQIIRKRLDLSEEFFINHYYGRGVWMFYQAYALSLQVLGRADPDVGRKNLIWKRCMRRADSFDSKEFQDMISFVEHDKIVVIEALKFIADEREKGGDVFGDLYKPGTIGCLSYEFLEEP